MQNSSKLVKKKVVIIGGGFGGLAAAKSLKGADVDVVLIDRHNYHLFQPLLYQVATGELSPANIASPLRGILRHQKNVLVLLGEVEEVHLSEQSLVLKDGQAVSFDYLIVAAGATHSYFGRDEWQVHAPGLKTVEDATEIRKHILYAFEQAEKEENPLRREKWLTFVIVGGGPTGVELAGALSEIAHYTMRYDFRRINPVDAKILLVEASENPLDMYPESLTAKARENLSDLKVTLVNNSKVTDIFSDKVVITAKDGSAREIETKTVIWAAGVAASPLARKLGEASGAAVDRAGRISVQPDLTLPNYSNVMVIGDMSSFAVEGARPLPGLAPVAMQQGKFAAKRVIALVHGEVPAAKFEYNDRGSMAVIGRYHAIALIGKRQFSGFIAWFLWLTIHIMMIAQFRNRLLVAAQWAWTFFTRDRSARLITGEEPE
jgi:NADH dehydrogenase